MSIFIKYSKKIWDFLGDIDVFISINYITVINIFVISYYMEKSPNIFTPLYDIPLQQWFLIYGIKNISISIYLFLFIILLSILAINTLICVINRIRVLNNIYKNNKYLNIKKFASLFFHIGFLILLMGQLISHTLYKEYKGNILTTNNSIYIPNTSIKISLKKIDINFFPKDTHFMGMSNMAKSCSLLIKITDKEKTYIKKLSLNNPIYYKGWFIFIDNFSPKNRFSKIKPYVELKIKKDFGIYILFLGAIILFLGSILWIKG